MPFIALPLYFITISILVLYGLHRYLLLFLYYKNGRKTCCNTIAVNCWPKVTIQLPIYNEPYVVRRLIESVCQLDYPKELLDIQILDDSDDITSSIVADTIAYANQKGFAIEHITRSERFGFKAGALAEGLEKAKGEFVAIFDADFIVHQQFLRKILPYFSSENIGMVQTRWQHSNRNVSLLTAIQSMLIESHFVIEQIARSHSGRFFNFNGTSGIWRKRCIIESGGWQSDTLAEDLDLSYRAQLKGWKFAYIKESLSYAELPLQMNVFKQQQQRWVKGTIQVAKKLIPQVLKSKQRLGVKIEAIMHLTNYSVYVFGLMAALFIWPSVLFRLDTNWQKSVIIDISLCVVLTLSVFLFHICSQVAQGNKNVVKIIFYIPLLMSVSIGLSMSNSIAVIEALFKRKLVFYRTVKFGDSKHKIHFDWYKRNVVTNNASAYFEIILGIYFCLNFSSAFQHHLYQSLLFLSIFVIGFFYVGTLSLFGYKAELRF